MGSALSNILDNPDFKELNLEVIHVLFEDNHWAHIRTSNSIESMFATVRLRTTRTKNCGSRLTTLAMAFKSMHTAQKRMHRIRGYQLLADVIDGIKFIDGIRIEQDAA